MKQGKAEYWREQIRLAGAYAGGVREYCEKNGIRRQVYYYWKKRLRENEWLGRKPLQAFAQVEVVNPARDEALARELPDPRWLAEFLLALGSGR